MCGASSQCQLRLRPATVRSCVAVPFIVGLRVHHQHGTAAPQHGTRRLACYRYDSDSASRSSDMSIILYSMSCNIMFHVLFYREGFAAWKMMSRCTQSIYKLLYEGCGVCVCV